MANSFETYLHALQVNIRPEFDPEQFYQPPEHNGTNIGGNRDRDPLFETDHQQNAIVDRSKKVAKKFENSDLAAALLYAKRKTVFPASI